MSQVQISLKTHSFSQQTLGDYPQIIRDLFSVKAAAAQANAKVGLIKQSDADLIEKSCKRLSENVQTDLFPVDVFQGGGGIAIHKNIGEVLCEETKFPSSTINLSQSTSDVVATALRVSLYENALCLNSTLGSLNQSLKTKVKEFSQVKTLARTCLQDAMVIDMGQRFSGFATRLENRQQAFARASARLLQIRLGGTVIGTAEGASSEYRKHALNSLSKTTGLKLNATADLVAQSQSPDDLQELSSELRLLAEELLRFCKDLRLLASGPKGGFGELAVPKILEGSAFFTDKSNPTLFETMIQCCFLVIGRARTVDACVEHAELDLNIYEAMIGFCLYDSCRDLGRALANLVKYGLEGLTVVNERCQALSALAQKN